MAAAYILNDLKGQGGKAPPGGNNFCGMKEENAVFRRLGFIPAFISPLESSAIMEYGLLPMRRFFFLLLLLVDRGETTMGISKAQHMPFVPLRGAEPADRDC